MEVIRQKKNKICVMLCIIVIISLIPLTSFGLTVSNLYADFNNGTQFTNLLNYATRYDSFYNSKYIAFRDSQNSYYLVWGDNNAFAVENNVVTCSDCSYVRYYRATTNSDWEYLYSENDTLSLGCDYMVTTNLVGVLGFGSVAVDEWEYRTSIRRMGIVLGSMFIALGIMLAVRRD